MNVAYEDKSLIRWLCEPETYAHRPEHVDHLETHISHVFLAGEYAYKLKKCVRYEFLDFSTVSLRENACREEVRLNQRLAPDTYLGVVPVIREADGAFQLEGQGEIIDWLVAMRRLPTDLALDALWRRGQLSREHIDRLANALVRFYKSLLPLSFSSQSYSERCLAHVRGNFDELLSIKHHLPRGVVERIHGFQLQLLRLRPTILEKRARDGRIVDGHGDLRPEHICFGKEIAIFDCIEFNADFRRIDVADELAFLASECDYLGAEWVGPQLFQAYEAQSDDRPPAVLVDFYKSYRACVRAKVAALRADQLEGQSREAAIKAAETHLALADRYVAPWLRPLVVVLGGLAGTGKSTLARAVGEALGGEVLRTDGIRREVFGVGPHTPEADRGIYSPRGRELVYEEMLLQAAALYADRITVVLDGTFSSTNALRGAQRLIADPENEFLAIECTCRPEVAHARIRERLDAGLDASDARPEIHDVQRTRWQPWPADVPQICINTEQPLEMQVEQVIAAVGTKHWHLVLGE